MCYQFFVPSIINCRQSLYNNNSVIDIDNYEYRNMLINTFPYICGYLLKRSTKYETCKLLLKNDCNLSILKLCNYSRAYDDTENIFDHLHILSYLFLQYVKEMQNTKFFENFFIIKQPNVM